MKQFRLFQFVALIVILFASPSCLKDNLTKKYTIFTPVYQTLTEARANMKSNASKEVQIPGKLFIRGNYIFLNEVERGIHVIDNSDPINPKNISFINIPGNVDLAVQGNILYADSYSDLVTFDISDPKNITAKKFLNNVFPHRNVYYGTSTNPDSIRLVVDWVKKDTMMDVSSYARWEYNCPNCMYFSGSMDKSASPGPGGKGGSMARFTIMNTYLYTVSNSDLTTFNIANPSDPQLEQKIKIADGTIETIYPFRNNLFIGSNNGMFIFDITTPSQPVKVGAASHVRSCDPVIAEEDYAYVTLRSGTSCQGFTNQLEIFDISKISNPVRLKTFPMSNPHGLSKDGKFLFICDGTDGVKIYDAADINAIRLIKHIKGLDSYDVIAWNKRALVVAKDGLYQFDYSDENNIRQLSKISLED